MSKVLINLEVSIQYNAHLDNEEIKDYSFSEEIDENYTLKEAIESIYKLHNIELTEFQKNHKLSYLTNYLFSKLHGFYIEYDYNDAINTKIGLLNDVFNISNNTLRIYYIDGIGATSGEFEGIKFIIHTDEKDIHHNKHVHCEYSGEEMRVELETLNILDKPFTNKKKVKRALELIKNNKDGLIEMWDKLVIKGEPFKFNMEG